MKKLGLIGAVLTGAALLMVWQAAYGRAAADARAEIAQIEQKALDAMTADELVAFYDPNDIITYDYITPLQYVGIKAVHDDVDKFFSKTKDLKGDFLDLKIETDDAMAVAHSLQHFTWKDLHGKPHEAAFRVTNCYHKVDGKWKIFHMHTSFPIDPATGQAQMNLKN
ncbi:MAG: nuclear transport factor 2 family protein [Deltaproteobacteria bacterium]|nr:nuclear transport factor 2 family protein [Deltaproteobacteria bacterium]